jgi:CRP/FNR family transcriptional regulator, cyclic AMP receptor protein
MSEDFLGLFGDDAASESLSAGQVLFNKGDAADRFYVVKSGELQILDGNRVFETVGPGGLVGEMALVDHSLRSATVRAVAASEVIPLDEKRFLFMVQQTPFFAVRVMRVMSARLRAMNEQATALPGQAQAKP